MNKNLKKILGDDWTINYINKIGNLLESLDSQYDKKTYSVTLRIFENTKNV